MSFHLPSASGRFPFARHALARHSREGGNQCLCFNLSKHKHPPAYGERVVHPTPVTPWLVIPAKAGIQRLCFGCKEQSFHSPAASGSLSLACARESNQREAHPHIALFGLLPEKSASAAGFR